jgi:hypothetical protein
MIVEPHRYPSRVAHAHSTIVSNRSQPFDTVTTWSKTSFLHAIGRSTPSKTGKNHARKGVRTLALSNQRLDITVDRSEMI